MVFDPVTDYAEKVVAGSIVAGRPVVRACQRHLWDVAHQSETGLEWRLDEALNYISFCKDVLRLNGGEFEGVPFELLPWQQFVGGSLFGWYNSEGNRRFRTAFVIASKGAGKTPGAASAVIYIVVADGDFRSEGYIAGAKLSQAQVAFRDCVAMVQQSPELANILKMTGGPDREWNISYPSTHSFIRAIGSDKKSQSGPRPKVALLDEIHEHPNSTMVDMMRYGTKNWKSPLIYEISNMPQSSTGPCADHLEYSLKLMDGFDKDDGLKNDTFFAYVCQLDPCEKCAAEGHTQPNEGCEDCDSWLDEAVWPKVSPSLPVIPGYTNIRENVNDALGMPNKEAEVKRLYFCLKTRGGKKAIDPLQWEACGDARERIKSGVLKGKPCHVGLDIGSVSDFTAMIQLFPHDDEETILVPIDPEKPDGPKIKVKRRSYTFIPHFWLCAVPNKRDEAMESVIENWVRQGFVTRTQGNATDYAHVLYDMKALDKLNPFVDIAMDYGHQGVAMATDLQAYWGEKKVSIVRAGILSMNSPFRTVLELLKTGKLHHGKHPVMTWMAGNVVAVERQGLIMPDKDKSIDKIDGITGLCMAMVNAMKSTVSGGWYKRGILSGKEKRE